MNGVWCCKLCCSNLLANRAVVIDYRLAVLHWFIVLKNNKNNKNKTKPYYLWIRASIYCFCEIRELKGPGLSDMQLYGSGSEMKSKTKNNIRIHGALSVNGDTDFVLSWEFLSCQINSFSMSDSKGYSMSLCFLLSCRVCTVNVWIKARYIKPSCIIL